MNAKEVQFMYTVTLFVLLILPPPPPGMDLVQNLLALQSIR